MPASAGGIVIASKREEGPDVVRSEPRRPGRPSLSNEALLDKAFALFLEQGFERTSLDAITAAAGMAKRTVYQRYGDKETLFREALKRAIDQWIVPLETLRQVETDDLEETLLAIGRVLVSNIMSPAGIGLLRITNAESGRLPEIGAYTYELGTERTIAYLGDLLRRRLDPDSTDFDMWHEAGVAYLYLVVSGPPTMTAWGMTVDMDIVDHHTRFGVHLFLNGLHGWVAGSGKSGAASPSTAEGGNGDVDALRTENARLKRMLIAAMLETADLRERSEKR